MAEIKEEDRKYSSSTEKFLDKTYSRYLLSLPGRILVLIAFLAYAIVSVFGIMNLEIKFSTRFFVDERFYLFNYFDA